MNNKKGIAGNKGQGIKSDCFVEIELTDSGGLNIEIKSKVEVLYANAIDTLITEILGFYEIKNANIFIDDSGALDFTLAARTEAAIRQHIPAQKEYFPAIIKSNRTYSNRFQRRFSRLYLPGNSPKLFINAGIHKPDCIILDLEDSVAPGKKDEARILVRNALRQVNFYGAERMVRINQLPLGLQDLEMIVPHYVNVVLIPKVESGDQVREVENKVNEILEYHNLSYPVWFMPIVESAKGVVNAYDIAIASGFNAALAIGLEDYTADIGVTRSREGIESFYARSSIVNAANAAGIQAIDSVFSDVDDTDGLTETIKVSKQLGFVGMGCIHPRQIPIIHQHYAPTEDEIEKAKKIILAFKEAESKGLGVVSLGTKMIDAPVVKKAEQILNAALKSGKPATKQELNTKF